MPPSATEFRFPPGATAPLAERVSRALHASPDADRLRAHAFVLDTFLRAAPPPAPVRAAGGYGALAGRWRTGAEARRWKADLLVVGECSGASELAFLSRLVDGLARSGRTVLCLAASAAEERWLKEAGWGGRVAVLRVPDVRSRARFWAHPPAYAAWREDLEVLTPVLRAAGASIWSDAVWPMRQVALARCVWRRLAPAIDCSAVIVRSNYRPLSAAVLAAEASTGRLTLCFQHSVVTAPASFVPIPSRRFVAFGAASRVLLERLDREQPRLCGQVIAAGSLLDEVLPSGPPAPAGPVLVIDSGEGFATRFLGADGSYQALEALVPTLAAAGHQVVVRAHPRGGARRWRRLVRGVPGASVSTGRPLAEDLRGAALVTGLFSTVLPVAAASGVPTAFLWKEGWFSTPDLAPFMTGHFVSPEELPERLRQLRSATAWDQARAAALEAARSYVAGLRRCEFTPGEVEALLGA